MNRYWILFFLLLVIDSGSAQKMASSDVNTDTAHPWDRIQFIEQLNQEEVVRTLADYRGKLVVLDFWNIWCSNCIAAMPKLDSLQLEFSDDLKILCVTTDDRTKVDGLFRRTGLSFDHLAFVTNDSLLSAQFPYRTVPHHVWIDREGKLLHNTYGHNLNKESIAAVLHGDKLDVIEKRDISFDLDIPLPLQESILTQTEYSFFLDSLIAGALYNYENLKQEDGFIRYRGVNILPLSWARNIVQMRIYNQFFGGRYSSGDALLELSDSVAEMFKESDSNIDRWRIRHMRSYERQVKNMTLSDFSTLLMEDFSHHFNLDARWEPTYLNLWEFHRDDNYKPIAQNLSESRKFYVRNGSIHFFNASIADFIRCLVLFKRDQGKIMVDTGSDLVINGQISLEKLINWENVVEFLLRQGILLKENRLKVEKLRITKRGEP